MQDQLKERNNRIGINNNSRHAENKIQYLYANRPNAISDMQSIICRDETLSRLGEETFDRKIKKYHIPSISLIRSCANMRSVTRESLALYRFAKQHRDISKSQNSFHYHKRGELMKGNQDSSTALANFSFRSYLFLAGSKLSTRHKRSRGHFGEPQTKPLDMVDAFLRNKVYFLLNL